MRVIIPADMKWDKKVFLKAVRGADTVKVVTIVDSELLSLSVELAAEKGWLGDGTVSKLLDVLKQQMERMRKVYEENATKLLKERSISFTFEHAEGNFKEIVSEIAKERPENITFTYKKGYNPYWQVVKPVIHDLCKHLEVDCHIVK